MGQPERRWIVRVHWESSDGGGAAAVLEQLRDYTPVVLQHPVDAVWETTISLSAQTEIAAAAAATDLMQEAVPGAHVVVEVLREQLP